MSGCWSLALNYLFIGVQTSILLCYFLYFAQCSQSSYVEHVSKLFTMPHTRSQNSLKTSVTQISMCFVLHHFGTVPLQHCICRSRCIWWDLKWCKQCHLWLYLLLILTARPSCAAVSLFLSFRPLPWAVRAMSSRTARLSTRCPTNLTHITDSLLL